MTNRKLRWAATVPAAAAIALITSGIVAPAANAHGFISGPISRAAACQKGLNTNCGAIQWEPQSVEGPKGFPQGGPADGRIASGGTHFTELDAQSPTRWYKNDIKTGPLEFKWTYTAPHSTAGWHYYITKQGWDQNAPLARASLEKIAAISHDYSPASNNPNHVVNIPTDRSGYHIVLGVWDIGDTANAFYQAVDVNITAGTPDTQAPSTPSGLAASNVASSSVTLNWQSSTDDVAVTGYRVLRNGVQIASPNSNNFQDTGLTPSTTYTYSVQAVDAAGNVSPASSSITVTTDAAPAVDTEAPSIPSGLHSMGVTTNSADLMWTASTDNVGVKDYVVYRNGTQVGVTTGTTFTNTGLAADTTYSYTVRARDAAGNLSAASAAASVTTLSNPATDSQAPTAPSGLHSMDVTSNSAKLMWGAASDNVGVKDYVIYRNGTQVGTSSTTSFTDSGLTANTSYSYTVKARDAAGNVSAASTAHSVTTLAGSTPGKYPAWSSFGKYAKGAKVSHNGQNYECIQAYQGWGDPNWILAPSLWKSIR